MAGQTRSGMAVGTPGYMAPEQARGQRLQIGPATDVYALGVLLYEMITGRLPFQAATPMDVMLKVAREEPTPPSRVRPRLPRDLETICLKCLEKDPARRYGSALDLAEDLRAFSAHEPIRARPVPRWERCLRWVRRRPAALLLVTLTLLAASLVTAATASAYAERQRLGGLRAEARDKVQQGRIAFDHRRWNEVRALLSPVVPRIQEEPALAGLSQEARQLLEPAEAHLATQAHYDKFLHLRAEVLFEAALVGGDGSPDRLRQIRGLVEQALAEVLERADAPAAPPPELRAQPVAFNPLLTEEQAQEARQGCYDLLLVLADATAQCAPRDAPAVRSSRAWAALAVLDRAARLGLRTHAFHLRRAAYLGQAGDESEASAERARAAAHPLKTAFDHYLAGTTRYHWQHFDKAREGLRQALELQPRNFWALYYRALCDLRLAAWKKGPDRLRALASACEHLTYCLASDTVRGPGPADTSPRALWIYLARGYAEGRQGHYRKAKADFARAEALLQKRPNLRASYALLNNRAVTLLAAQEFDAAQADLQRAIALRPEQFHPYLSLAEIRVRRQDLVGALRYLDRGVAAAEALRARREVDDDTLARLYRRRHGVHLQCRHHGDALADLERVCALPLPPAGRALGHRERGQLLAHLGRHADALAAYDASLAARPEAETYRWRGELLLTLKRYPEAARSFDAYLRAGGEPTAFVYQARARARARARLKADDPAGAVADATHALEMGDPDGGSAAVGLRLLRGQAHLAGHAYPLAVRDFEEVLARQAEDEARGTAYLGRGLARFRLGRVAEAAADAEEAVKHAPANRRVVYAAAGLLAQAAGQVTAGRGARAGDRRLAEARRRYRDQAVRFLRRALLLVPEAERAAFWRDTVCRDRSLLPLRSSAAYDRLARQLGLPMSAGPG